MYKKLSRRKGLIISFAVAAIILIAGFIYKQTSPKADEGDPYTQGGLLEVVIRQETGSQILPGLGTIDISGDCAPVDSAKLGPSSVSQVAVSGTIFCQLVRVNRLGEQYFHINSIVFSSLKTNKSYTIPLSEDPLSMSDLVLDNRGGILTATVKQDSSISVSIERGWE